MQQTVPLHSRVHVDIKTFASRTAFVTNNFLYHGSSKLHDVILRADLFDLQYSDAQG